MANTPAEGKRWLFFADPSNGGDYYLVVCLTSQSYERAANVIDASSKCGTAKLNGVKDRTIQIEGIVNTGLDAVGEATEQALNNWFENDIPIGWAFGPEFPEAGEYTYSGTDALISNLSISAPQDGAVTFSATVQLNGVPVVTVGS